MMSVFETTSPARIASHDWAIRILTHELGGIKLQALTVDDVEAALARRTIPTDEQPTPRKGRGRAATSALSRNSLIKLRSTLSQALTWAQRRDLVTRNVAALAELPTGATTVLLAGATYILVILAGGVRRRLRKAMATRSDS